MIRLVVRVSIAALMILPLVPTATGDIYYYAVAKAVGYTQTSAAPPAAPDSWLFVAGLDYNVPEEVLSATITFDAPPLTTVDMAWAGETAQRYYSISYASEAELDLGYPSTTYTFSADRGLGTESADVFLPAGLYPPETPYFTADTFDRLQGMDPARDFDGTVSGFEAVSGTNYAATYVIVAADGVGGILTVALTPSESAFQIPAGLLLPDTDYSIGVQHQNGVETISAGFDSANSYAEFSRSTVVYFRTMSDAAPCPGDVNGDGVVDLTDLAILLSNFGTLGGASLADGDLNGDEIVDLNDLAILLSQFGAVCP